MSSLCPRRSHAVLAALLIASWPSDAASQGGSAFGVQICGRRDGCSGSSSSGSGGSGGSSREPSAGTVEHNTGVRLFNAGRHEEALEYFMQAHRMDPSESLYAFNMAVALVKLSRYAEALKFFEHTLRLEKGHVRALWYSAWLNGEMGYWDDALRLYKEAARRQPKEHEFRSSIAVAYYKLGDLDAARDAAREFRRNGGNSERYEEIVEAIDARKAELEEDQRRADAERRAAAQAEQERQERERETQLAEARRQELERQRLAEAERQQQQAAETDRQLREARARREAELVTVRTATAGAVAILSAEASVTLAPQSALRPNPGLVAASVGGAIAGAPRTAMEQALQARCHSARAQPGTDEAGRSFDTPGSCPVFWSAPPVATVDAPRQRPVVPEELKSSPQFQAIEQRIADLERQGRELANRETEIKAKMESPGANKGSLQMDLVSVRDEKSQNQGLLNFADYAREQAINSYFVTPRGQQKKPAAAPATKVP